jgi:hypothetical protein
MTKVQMSKPAAAALAALALAGCASKSSDIAAAYVSPLQYDSFSCHQLAEEAQRVSARASVAAGAQDSQSTKDAVATTAAVIIFWPAAFLVGGDKQTAAELARLKGEMEAIEQVSIRKNCGIQFRRAQG